MNSGLVRWIDATERAIPSWMWALLALCIDVLLWVYCLVKGCKHER